MSSARYNLSIHFVPMMGIFSSAMTNSLSTIRTFIFFRETNFMASIFRSLFMLVIAFLSCYAQENQVEILLDIKENLVDPQNALSNWDNSSLTPCQWNGVTCNNASSVTNISLENRGLSGQLPSVFCRLSKLRSIQLGYNNLYGEIPNGAFENCSQLEVVNLTTNSLKGSLPDFSALSSLQVLDVSKNNFSGTFPLSVTNLFSLNALHLNDNPLDQGLIPNEIYSLKGLTSLQLSNVTLNGTISPSVGNLTGLVNLELSCNYLVGTIPKEITRLTKLIQLELYNNYLEGELPSGFGNLTLLRNFDASQNSLNGTLSELASLKNLVSLQLYMNNFSGTIPDEIGNLQYLRDLSLYTNNLTGPLPQELGSLSNLSAVDVSENALTGFLPPNVCVNGKLVFFLALENSFTGEIPQSYGECSTLVRFRVSNNLLSGKIPPGIWGLPHATIIDLSYNNFEGAMGTEIMNAKNLSIISLQNNNFSGVIPSEIGQALILTKMDASNNQFSGELPNGIGNLGKLTSLLLQQNMLSGPIPDQLGVCEDLSEINLAGNGLSGPIPGSLGSIPVLNSLNLSNNQLSGQIPNTLSRPQFSLLDFSNNQLTGPVPIQLISLANNKTFSGNKGLCQNQATSNFLSLCPSTSRKRSHTRFLIAGLMSAAAVVILIIGWCTWIKKIQNRNLQAQSWNMKSFHRVTFTEDDILGCLKEENLIGSGGSGNVYKGELSNGEIIAVKRLLINDSIPKFNHRQGAVRNRQFEMEVETLSSIRHRNIVKLYCCMSDTDSNSNTSLLVYQYMKNGSLWSRLHEEPTAPVLDWHTRYKIALGTAQGLAYLHHDCVPAIVHRDVKSSNILLNEDYEPQLSDFGVAKILQGDGRGDSTANMVGTHGYIAPEYAYTTKVNEKSDVYSFGVVLMELVTGKRPIDDEFGDNKDIVHWVYGKMAKREGAFELLDGRISKFCEEGMMKTLRIAVMCTSNLPALRPCMAEVVQMLWEAHPYSQDTVNIIVDMGKL